MNRLADPADRRLPLIPPPCAMVVFGATGDLARRKILPAVYDLASRGLLPAGFSLTGVGRSPLTREDFIRRAHAAVASGARTPFRQRVWEQLAASIDYVSGDVGEPATYSSLGARLEASDQARGTAGRRVFYLSMPPATFGVICARLAESGLAGQHQSPASPPHEISSLRSDISQGHRETVNEDPETASAPDRLEDTRAADGWNDGIRWGTASDSAKVVVEKPFGHDLASARELDRALARAFPPAAVFRIDHYLGKEAVRGMLALRFANQVFEPLWCCEHVDHVQITMAEELGVGSRAGYYDGIGATRDVMQNHLLQLLAITAMDRPASFGAADLRAAKEAALEAARLAGPAGDCAARGQYAAGWQGNVKVRGYLEEDGIAPDSTTDTYGALKLEVATDRWRGTPFYLRTGKRLGRRVTEVALMFKRPAAAVPDGLDLSTLGANALVVRVQPDQGVTLRVGAKVPQTAMEVRDVTMDFAYGHAFTEALPDAYERLLLDVMEGRDPLFPRAPEVEASWRIVDEVEAHWAALGTPPEPYPAGTWGPEAAADLLRRDGREWRRP
ncbi:MAG: glucose-6-phosphate dehydrogenase [Bifidobacteriaceae bacterium]|jgi:glucose-6-phosphate 1-dehydrogenase|nr:glucose-6-phosphate dehydrogenase [Bifidobacteriaceae bacterium]